MTSSTCIRTRVGACAVSMLLAIVSTTSIPAIAQPRERASEAAAATTSAPAVPATATATTEHNRQLVTAAFDRWAAGASNVFADLLSPDVVWTIEGSGPTAGTFHGIDAFTAGALTPFVSRLQTPVRPTTRRIWADGDHVIIHWSGQATARDGKPYHNDYAWIFRMHDSKVMEATAFLDLAPYDDVIRRIPAADAARTPR